MNKHAKKQTETQVLVSEQGKFDYKALVAECKALGLDTKGKAFELDARIEEYHAANTPAVVEEVKSERRGRPIDPNSPRQKRLALQSLGTGRRGRPADPESDWNKKQRLLEEKRAADILKLGRPIDPNSARQARLALVGKVKRGRPKMIKEEIPTAVEAIVDAEAENVLESMLDGGTEV